MSRSLTGGIDLDMLRLDTFGDCFPILVGAMVRVQGLGFRALGLGVLGLGEFKVKGFGFRVQSAELGAWGLGLRLAQKWAE